MNVEIPDCKVLMKLLTAAVRELQRLAVIAGSGEITLQGSFSALYIGRVFELVVLKSKAIEAERSSTRQMS